jgi:hypothetical protein
MSEKTEQFIKKLNDLCWSYQAEIEADNGVIIVKCDNEIHRFIYFDGEE